MREENTDKWNTRLTENNEQNGSCIFFPINHFLKCKLKAVPNSSYKASITPIPKPDNDTTREENYRSISLMNIDAKFSTKYEQIKSMNTFKDHTSGPSGFTPGMQEWINLWMSINMIYHISRIKD